MKIRPILLGAGILFVATAIGSVALINSLNGFETVAAYSGPTCAKVPGIVGAEDIVPDYQRGIADVSSNDRRAALAGDEQPGAIYLLDLNNPRRSQAVKMSGTENLASFHPHGADLLEVEGERYLFVLSHRAHEKPDEGHDVYVFQIEGTRLNLVNHVDHAGIRSPNDIAAVSLSKFYFTNDRGFTSPTGNFLEIGLALETSDVSFFDGEQPVLMDQMAFANGIAFDRTRDKVYVTALREGAVRVYARDPQTNGLTQTGTLPGGGAPDNVTLDEGGDLWTASHENLMALTDHMADGSALSPARAFHTDPHSGETELVYEDDGRQLSAISVIVPTDTKLLLGAIFDDGILVCNR